MLRDCMEAATPYQQETVSCVRGQQTGAFPKTTSPAARSGRTEHPLPQQMHGPPSERPPPPTVTSSMATPRSEAMGAVQGESSLANTGLPPQRQRASVPPTDQAHNSGGAPTRAETSSGAAPGGVSDPRVEEGRQVMAMRRPSERTELHRRCRLPMNARTRRERDGRAARILSLER